MHEVVAGTYRGFGVPLPDLSDFSRVEARKWVEQIRQEVGTDTVLRRHDLRRVVAQ